MAKSKVPFAEGASIHRPPMCCGLNYQFWKRRMQIFIESISRKTSLGVNGMMKKEEELNMIAMPRTSSLHL